VRPRSQDDITYVNSYTRCAKTTLGYYETAPPELRPIAAGEKVRLIDAYVWLNYGSVFGIVHTEDWLYPMSVYSEVTATTQLSMDDFVTIIGTVAPNGLGGYCVVADGVYLGGSTYGAMSVGRRTASRASAVSASSVFRPWPYPTAEEILSSPGFAASDARQGCIGWALSQPDGTVVDLTGQYVSKRWYNGAAFGLKEPFEPGTGADRLVLFLNTPVGELGKLMSIDIVGGTLATLSSGQRAILYPKAVYVYTDSKDQPAILLPKWMDRDGNIDRWPWRKQIYP
jgi:hypothetical protein